MWVLAVAFGALMSGASCGRNVAPPVARPNVVLVVGCTVRQDQLAPYGGLAEASPFLAEMARNGVMFTDAFTSGAWTRISSSAIFTGQPFRSIGMAEPGAGANRRALSPELVLIPEVFHDAGYRTLGAVANPNLNTVFGFGQGYDDYYQTNRQFKDGGTKFPGRLLVENELEVLDKGRDDRPLFLSFVMLDPHEPLQGISNELARSFLSDGAPFRVGKYRAGLRRFDHAVELLWKGLNERGYDDSNTILIVVNDHGEGIKYPSAADGMGHGRFLRPSVTGMVWLVRGAGVARNHRIGGMASQVDVMPTVLGLAGLPIPSDVAGRDWSALVRGAGDRTSADAAFVDTDMGATDRSAIYTPDRACFIDRAEGSASRSCWDRASDPALAGDPLSQPDEAALQRLDAWRAEIDARLAAYPHTTYVQASDQEMKMLEALGYAQEDEPPAAADP